MLLISRQDWIDAFRAVDQFQSRNRDAFDFKSSRYGRRWRAKRFNLVIEMLLISRAGLAVLSVTAEDGFNLVIEMLLISSNT